MPYSLPVIPTQNHNIETLSGKKISVARKIAHQAAKV